MTTSADYMQPPPGNPDAQSEEREVRFKYVGTSSLSLLGAITFRKYLFRYPGDVVLVDARDAPAFSAEAELRKQ